MANELKKFSAGDVEAGINLFGSDFSSDYALDVGTKNVATGINAGSGPRQGMSPIPNHSALDTVGDGPEPQEVVNRGLRASEQSGDELTYFVDRKKFLGVIPLINTPYEDDTVSPLVEKQGNQFLWLLTDTEAAQTDSLSAVASSLVNISGPDAMFRYTFNLADGFTNNTWAQFIDDGSLEMDNWNSPLLAKLAAPNNTSFSGASAEEWIRELLSFDPTLFYCSNAVITVSGNKWPMQWLCGEALAGTGSSTTTANANFTRTTISTSVYPMGICPSWNNRDFKKNNRNLTFWNLALYVAGLTGVRLNYKFVYTNYPVNDATYNANWNQDTTQADFSVTGNASLAIPNDNGDAYSSNNVRVLLNDPEAFCDSSYRIALIAAKKPMGFFIQNWQRDVQGRNVQIAPLTDRLHKPKTNSTNCFPTSGTTYYTEDGVQVSTCFSNWPNFVSNTATTAFSMPSGTPAQMVTISTTAGSGVLRANTTYEITFSVFDKQLGTETNVGAPAKIRTSSTDNVALSLYIDAREAGPGDWYQYMPATTGVMPIEDENWAVGSNQIAGWANYLELRFYYRALGTYEWLPALFIDATKYWYYPDHQVLWACQGNVAGLPGGQPGGYNDYSFLPEDTYDCVVNFRSRAFWFSKNNCVFSLRNNPFAYPLRNSAPAPTGGFKGAIAHTYRGQSEQGGRLVIFGDKETYIGKFSGLPFEMPVTISPNVTEAFALDGSDFTIETWTSITSFSHRSAVVADGDLFWWGPEGIYKDNGVGNPEKVSDALEPNIFNLYSQEHVDEIHCIYDEKTKLIWWFYPPASDATISHAIALNIETGAFFFEEFDCKVDWAQRIQTNNPGVSQNTNGLRTILGVREDSEAEIQRGVFFDQFNRSGDYQPQKELLVKEVAVGASSTQRIITLDSGFDAASFAEIVTGDYLALQQFERYTGQAADDIIAKVVSTDAMAGEITLNLPSGATYPAYAATDSRNYWPMWHKKRLTQGLNGIPWSFRTKYWCPMGPNFQGIWQWMYFMMKYVAWKKIDSETFNVAYRTPAGGDFISDVVEFVNNSDANMQVFHAFRQHGNIMTTGMNNNGQAVKFDFSGIHIGDEWQLQFFELQGELESGNTLKQFQG